MDPRLELYLKDVLRTAHGDTALPSALEDKMVKDLYLQLEQRLTDFIFEQLKEEEHQRYFELADKETPIDTIVIFLEDRIPNIRDTMSDILQSFRNEYVSWISAGA